MYGPQNMSKSWCAHLRPIYLQYRNFFSKTRLEDLSC